MEPITNSTNQLRGISVMSKKRFHEIQNVIKNEVNNDDILNRIIKQISEIMQFDPNLKVYNAEAHKKRYDALKIKAEEQGVQVTDLNGHKKYYLKKKAEYNKKSYEYKQKKSNLTNI